MNKFPEICPVLPGCEKCIFNCKNFTESIREKINREYWSLKDWNKGRDFFLKFSYAIKTTTKNEKSTRSNHFK